MLDANIYPILNVVLELYFYNICITYQIIFVLDTFKKMFKQKMKEMEKAYEKQVKELKAKKASGQSKKSAVSICVQNF